MTQKLAWGIIGTGNIAQKIAEGIVKSQTGKLVAVASRTQASADAFAKTYGIASAYEGYDKLLADPAVQAVYISLPNHMHAEWSIKAAHAGKHILCEKPLTLNFPEAMYMLEKVRETGVLFMEAFMYRCHPQIAKVVQLIKDGAIGQVRVIEAAFGYNMGPKYDNIRLQHDAGGGGILDVGCYTVSACRLFAGAALGKDFVDVQDLRGHGYIGPVSRVDEYAVATLKFPGDIVGQVACACQVNLDNKVTIYGDQGTITIHRPWIPQETGNIVTLHQSGKEPQDLTFDFNKGVRTFQVDAFADALAKGLKEVPAPAMSMEDTMSNMRALDMWRGQVGLKFASEKAENINTTYAGTKLAKSPRAQMPYAKIPGCDKPISRVVMGTMIYSPAVTPLTFAMLDYFFEIGGNCIDMAYGYGDGQSEVAIGKWIAARGIREQVVLLDKGAHPPNDQPDKVGPQLMTSLERLGVDYLDIYCLHRDNTAYPVSEWVEAMEVHRKAGRIRLYGGSNWTTQRIQEANEYCRQKGYPGFQASSPNFSLAVWNRPMWAGCLAASDKTSRQWYEKHQVPIFSWSSQASGFFAGRVTEETKNSPDWYQRDAYATWYNDENFARLQRAKELAQKHNVTATQIAMAYVLSQPFPTFALIGPRTIQETRTSVQGVTIKLTDEERRFLVGES